MNNTWCPLYVRMHALNYFPHPLIITCIVSYNLHHILMTHLINHFFHQIGNEKFIFYLPKKIHCFKKHWTFSTSFHEMRGFLVGSLQPSVTIVTLLSFQVALIGCSDNSTLVFSWWSNVVHKRIRPQIVWISCKIKWQITHKKHSCKFLI